MYLYLQHEYQSIKFIYALQLIIKSILGQLIVNEDDVLGACGCVCVCVAADDAMNFRAINYRCPLKMYILSLGRCIDGLKDFRIKVYWSKLGRDKKENTFCKLNVSVDEESEKKPTSTGYI